MSHFSTKLLYCTKSAPFSLFLQCFVAFKGGFKSPNYFLHITKHTTLSHLTNIKTRDVDNKHAIKFNYLIINTLSYAKN